MRLAVVMIAGALLYISVKLISRMTNAFGNCTWTDLSDHQYSIDTSPPSQTARPAWKAPGRPICRPRFSLAHRQGENAAAAPAKSGAVLAASKGDPARTPRPGGRRSPRQLPHRGHAGTARPDHKARQERRCLAGAAAHLENRRPVRAKRKAQAPRVHRVVDFHNLGGHAQQRRAHAPDPVLRRHDPDASVL